MRIEFCFVKKAEVKLSHNLATTNSVLASNAVQECILLIISGMYNNLHFAPLDLLTIEAHVFTPEPVKYEKKDGQWYTHDGVDVIETQTRKGTESADLFNWFVWLMVLFTDTKW